MYCTCTRQDVVHMNILCQHSNEFGECECTEYILDNGQGNGVDGSLNLSIEVDHDLWDDILNNSVYEHTQVSTSQ